MPVREVDVHPPYEGMGTSYDPASLPPGRAQFVQGFTPARRGKMRLAPLIKRLQQNLGLGDIHAHAVWLSAAGQGDRLLFFHNASTYSVPLYQTWKLDERIDGQHSFYQFGTPTVVTGGAGGDASLGFACIQFKDELIFSRSGFLSRYYVENDGLGTEHCYSLGVTPPLVPTASADTGGSMTGGATYEYEITFVDERNRESSPSPSVSVTLSGFVTYTAVNVTQNTGPYVTGGGETTWNIYRRNPGSATFNLVTNLPLATTTFKDTLTDDVVNGGQAAPTPGENDPPTLITGILPTTGYGTANVLAVWKDRLVVGATDLPTFAISNADSSTQFSSLPLPDNLSDGTRVHMHAHGQNSLTGMESLGSLLAVFGRESTSLMYGDNIADFALRETLRRGCINPNGIQRCENVILFPSDDGVYSIGYEGGYSVSKVSQDIDDIFRGWTETKREAFDVGRLSSVQVSNALFGGMCSWYSENRYYLSFGNRTLCYDLQTGGWTDTGWGFVKRATRYMSQMASLAGSAPETVFLTLGSVGG